MKKMSFVLMALALILFAMPVMAGPIGGNTSETIQVNITVARYAAISNAGTVDITISGPGEASGTADFDVLANFDYDIDVDTTGLAGDAQFDASVAGAMLPGKTSTWTLTVDASAEGSEGGLEYLLAGDYEGSVTVSVVDAIQ